MPRAIEQVVDADTLAHIATGNCYHSAFVTLRSEQERFNGWVLCHGRPVLTGGPFEGCEFGHAWIESPDGRIVFDTEKFMFVPAHIYYMVGQITKPVIKFSLREAWMKSMLFGHYGPWEQEN